MLVLPIVVLALIGKGICWPQDVKLFDASWNMNDVLIARNDATEILDGKLSVSSSWFLEKIGWRNSERNPNAFIVKHPSQTHVITLEKEKKFVNPVINADLLSELESEEEYKKLTEGDAILAAEFREKVNEPLYRCLVDSYGLPLKTEAMDKFDSLIIEIMGDVNGFHEGMSAHEGPGVNDPSVEPILRKMIKAQKIVKKPRNLKENTSVTAKPLLSMAFRLNDILLKFLVTADKHRNICSEEKIAGIFGGETVVGIVFNYILRYSAWHRDVAALYLNYDLRQSLEESPFTEEIHGILKYFTEEKWESLESSYLYATLCIHSEGNKAPTSQAPNLEQLVKHYFKFPGRQNKVFDDMVNIFLEDIFKAIFRHDGKFGLNQILIELKLVHNLIKMMFKYDNVSHETIAKIKSSNLYPFLQDFENSIITLTNAMKTIYAGYGHTLQHIPLDPNAFREVKGQSENILIYLTDLKQVEGNLMFPKLGTKLEEEFFSDLAKNSKVPKSKGVSETSNLDLSPSITSSPNQKYLSSKDKIFNRESKSSLKDTSITGAIIQASQRALEEFEKIKFEMLAYNEHPLVFHKKQEEKLLRNPLAGLAKDSVTPET